MATDAISALGAGSGMDVKALATNLVEAERAPRKEIIDKKISKSEAGISGYSAIKFVLEGLKTTLMDIKDQSDFASLTTRNSQTSAVSVTASSSASAGSHSVSVTSLARAQRSLSSGFAGTGTLLNQGAAFNLNLTIGNGASQTIVVPNDKTTAAGVVSVINNANLGVKAQMINTGDSVSPFKIILTGNTGTANNFSLTATTIADPLVPVANLSFTEIPGQNAANGAVSVNGIALTPSTNTLKDIIPGVTLDLYAPTVGSANIDFIRDSSMVTTKMEAMVKAYNEANTMLDTVYNAKSSVETYGGALAGNSVVNSIRTQVREAIFKNDPNSTGPLKGLRDLGVSLDKNGVMTLDKAQLQNSLNTNFDAAVTMLTGNSENLSEFSQAPSGAVGAAFKSISTLLSSTGTIAQNSTNLTKRIADYKVELAKLEDRMTQLLARYNQQFGAMEGIVGQSKSLRTSLTSTFEGMMATYTKN